MEQSQSSKRIPLARFGFEGVLIVVSVLAALGIDSWWSARQLATEEQQVLRQLKNEFQNNAKLLLERRREHEQIVETVELILSSTGPDFNGESGNTDELRAAIDTMSRWWTYDPQMGVLAGLTQSGRLGIVSSDSLRNALASWPSRVQDLVEDEIFAREFTAEMLDPYLDEWLAMRNVVQIGRVGDSDFSDDLGGLLMDRKFENLVHHKYGLTLQVLREYDGVAFQIDEILDLVSREIEAD